MRTLHNSYLLSLCLFGMLAACAHKDPPMPETLTVALMRSEAETEKVYKSPLPSSKLAGQKEVHRVAVIADVDQDGSQELWSSVIKSKPNLVLIAGNSVRSTQVDRKMFSDQYRKIDENPSYRDLREKVPFMLGWNDLDYGLSHGDGTYPLKETAKASFVEYWNYIPSLQKPAQKGIEHSFIIGKNKRVQVIVLDTRYYSSPWLEDGGAGQFKKDWSKASSFLGEQQWAWLKDELKKKADYRIFVSPLHIGANSGGMERWGLFPHERQRFFDLLRETKVKRYLVVSGGQRQGSLAKVDLINHPPLYDFSVGPFNGTPNAVVPDRHYVKNPVEQVNFGLIEWSEGLSQLTLKLVGLDGKTLQSTNITFD